MVKNLPANAGDVGLSLIGEDFTCLGATNPVRHSYWVCARAHEPQPLKPSCHETHVPQKEKTMKSKALPPQLESSPAPKTRESQSTNEDPAQPKINK